MKILAKGFICILLSAMALVNSSCATYYVYKGSEKIVATRRAMEMRDPKAKAFALQKIKEGQIDQSGISIPVMEAVKERPWWMAGGVFTDVGTGILVKKGFDSMTDNGNDASAQKGANSADRNVAGENNIIIQGNGNNVTLSSAPDGLQGLGDGTAGAVPVGSAPVGSAPQ